MSNLLAIPLVQITVLTGNNEDWVDSLLFLVDETTGEQLDLRGIDFDMEIRRSVTDAKVLIGGSTKDGTLIIGDPPNYGYLIFNIPVVEMKQRAAGTYVGDVVGNDGQNTRRIVEITTLTLVEGVTK